MAAKPIPIPVPVEDQDDDEEQKCPPVGAPAWMATFADIATLLMAFFVLILSFAEMNVPRFKNVAGSLRNAFGIQREVPVIEQPRGTTILSLEFSPSPDPAVIEEITQDTTDTERPELETDQTGTDGDGMEGETGQSELAAALSEALANGSVTAETRDGEVVLTFTENASDTQQNGEADSSGGQADGQSTGTNDAENSGAMAQADNAEEGASSTEEQETDPAQELARVLSELAGGSGDADGNGDAERTAQIAEAELRVALRREVAQGLVSVEQREDRVIVTVGAGGAFPSGTADMTAEAREIMSRIAFSSMNSASQIEVSGHTDDVPVNPSSPFRDNLGLGAARAASVVREIANTGLIAENQMVAISRGESDPIADNSTAAGREQNRRIEIEISY